MNDYISVTEYAKIHGLDRSRVNRLIDVAEDLQVEIDEAKTIGREIIKGITWTLKMARDEVPRPNKRNWLEELQKEICEGVYR